MREVCAWERTSSSALSRSITVTGMGVDSAGPASGEPSSVLVKATTRQGPAGAVAAWNLFHAPASSLPRTSLSFIPLLSRSTAWGSRYSRISSVRARARWSVSALSRSMEVTGNGVTCGGSSVADPRYDLVKVITLKGPVGSAAARSFFQAASSRRPLCWATFFPRLSKSTAWGSGKMPRCCISSRSSWSIGRRTSMRIRSRLANSREVVKDCSRSLSRWALSFSPSWVQ
ncbi:MAG: hypothetical protein AMS14_11835 [Planctomycetes bacterium DG_20]|nr:MAG: hypothetical protein AMS14_11835 [Planctomycetes bacterium DG_20]